MDKNLAVADSHQIGAYHGAKRHHHVVSGDLRVKKWEAEKYPERDVSET